MDCGRKRLRKAVGEITDEAVETLRHLVRIPSVIGEEEAAQVFMAGLFNSLGLEIDLWYPQVSDLKDHPAFTMVDTGGLGGRPNLVGVRRGTGGGRSLILNGHVDVVSPGDEDRWKHKNPWSGSIEGDRLYGRGACDMKAGLLAGVFALKALIRAGLTTRGDVYLQSVIGEESGGCGTLACLVRGYKAGGAVIMEPTGMAVMPAQMGVTNFRLTVTGRAAHGCVRYEGVSAVEKFAFLYSGIRQWEAEREKEIDDFLFRDYPVKAPICIGTVHAGNWDSTVPDKLVAEGRLGFSTSQTLVQARKAFEDKVKELSEKDPWLKNNPPLVEWINSSWEPAVIDSGHPLVVRLSESFTNMLGRRTRLTGAPFGSDMRLFTEYGRIPALLFGPGDVRNAHFTDEFVPLQEYRDAIAVLADFILSWCNEEHDGDQCC